MSTLYRKVSCKERNPPKCNNSESSEWVAVYDNDICGGEASWSHKYERWEGHGGGTFIGITHWLEETGESVNKEMLEVKKELVNILCMLEPGYDNKIHVSIVIAHIKDRIKTVESAISKESKAVEIKYIPYAVHKCPNCDVVIHSGEKYCHECGVKINWIN